MNAPPLTWGINLKCVWPRMKASFDLVQGRPKAEPPPQPPVSPA
jgi:hypothetical protein